MKLSRRYFVVGASALAIIAAVPGLSEARFPHGAPSGFNGGAAQTNFNFLGGGDYAFMNVLKGAVNQWHNSDFSSNTPTPDLFDANGWPIASTYLSSHGLAIYQTPVPTQAERPGNYVAYWDGTGTLNLSATNIAAVGTANFTGRVIGNVLYVDSGLTGSVKKGVSLTGTNVPSNCIVQNQLTGTAGGVGTYQLCSWVACPDISSQSFGTSAGSQTSSGTAGAGRYVVSWTGNSIDLVIVSASGTTGYTYISNLVICHVDDEARLRAGSIFQDQFINQIKASGFGVVRFLNWANENNSNVTTWNTRKPVTYATYSASELRANVYGGVTTNSGNAYSVAAPAVHTSTGAAWTNGDAPSHGDTVTALFNASATQSGTCSLKVGTGGSSAAINMLGPNGAVLSVGANTYPVGGNDLSLATFVYDSLLNAWLKYGGALDLGSQGITNNVPPEICLQLAIAVGAHPWFVAPYLSLDTPTDYMPSLCAYVKANAPSWMIARYEGPNETWNSGSADVFPTGYASTRAQAYGWGADINNWYGRAMSILGQICASVYGIGNLGSTYECICGVWTVTAFPTGASSSDPRLTSALYVAGSGAGGAIPPSVSGIAFTRSAASGWVSAVAPANYWSPLERYTVQELIDGFGYCVTNAGNPSAQATIAANYAATGISQSGTVTVTNGTAAITWTANGRAVNDVVVFNTTPPTPFVIGTYYFVVAQTTNTVALSATQNGSAITPTGNGSPTLAYANSYNLAYLYGAFTAWKTWASGFGVNKLMPYEGCYSPDFLAGYAAQPNAGWYTPINSVTQGATTALNLATTSYSSENNITGTAGNPAAVGMAISITNSAVAAYNCMGPFATQGGNLFTNGSATINANNTFTAGQIVFITASDNTTSLGGFTLDVVGYYVVNPTGTTFQLSATKGGSPITVTSFNSGSNYTFCPGWRVTAVSGSQVTIDLDSSGFAAFTGTASAVYAQSNFFSNTLRAQAKNASNMQSITTTQFNQLKAAGATFPSLYNFTGPAPAANIYGHVWDLLEDVYQSPLPPQALAAAAFH